MQSEARMSLYADDATAIVCNKESISKIFLLSELYGHASGARLNKTKCQGILLGSLANNASFYPAFKWSDSPIKICGAFFHANDTAEFNWNQVAKKISCTKTNNRCSALTFCGKAIYLNKYILSKVWYLSQIFKLSYSFIRFINSYVTAFLWNKTPALLSWHTLIRSTDEGGIGLFHVETRANTFAIRHIYRFVSLAHTEQTANDMLELPRWFYFAKYWIGLQTRNYCKLLWNNNIPHAEEPPPFYKNGLKSLNHMTKEGGIVE